MSSPTKEQLKRNNARLQKWRIMINDGVYKDPSLLKSRVRKGIPQGIRILAWPQLVSLNKFKESSSVNYQNLINQVSNSIYDISLDIKRTFPEQEDSKYLTKSLNNVLKAISIVYPKIGYCQGMNFLTCRVLQVLSDENSFWLLHYCLDHDHNMRNLFIDPKNIQKQDYVFGKLIGQYLPAVKSVLSEQNIMMIPFALKWFLPFFSSVLQQELFNRIFQIYLIEGWSIMYAVGLILIKINEHSILKNSFEDNYTLLSKGIKVTNIDSFMEAVFGLNIQRNKIMEIENMYRDEKRDMNPNKASQANERQKSNLSFKGFKPRIEGVSYLEFQKRAQLWNFEALTSLKNIN